MKKFTKLGYLGGIAVLAVCGLLLYATDWDFLNSQFTAYEIRCGVPLIDLRQCSQLATTGYFVSTYRISTDQQFVVDEVSKYTKCEIVSRTNWKCTYDDLPSLGFGVKNGVFWEIPPEGYRAHGFFVPRWKFLLLKMGFTGSAGASEPLRPPHSR
jgi:hypothetical protein